MLMLAVRRRYVSNPPRPPRGPRTSLVSAATSGLSGRRRMFRELFLCRHRYRRCRTGYPAWSAESWPNGGV